MLSAAARPILLLQSIRGDCHEVLFGLALTLLAGTAMATDYTVGIVSHDINNYGVVTGTALNLYSITSGGVTLVPGSPYVWDKKDPMGNSYLPAIVEMDPAHGFVYVEYVATTLPYIVGFKVTAQGLVQQWAVEAEDAEIIRQLDGAGPGLRHRVLHARRALGGGDQSSGAAGVQRRQRRNRQPGGLAPRTG